jgi:RNA polymerase sigma-70 factor (ECF subfamily)
VDSRDDAQTEFSTLIRPHLESLYRLAFRLTGSRDDAEDLVQDVLVKVFGRRDEITSIAAPRAWLCRILYNHFVDQARRLTRRRVRVVPLGGTEAGSIPGVTLKSELPEPEHEAASEFDIRRLRAALDRLSLEHRAVVLMHDAEGYKFNEIQTITGIPVGTLKSRLHRARARLRELLSDDGTL